MGIHLVYVTGAYSSDTSAGRAKNIEAAKSAAAEIIGMNRGWYPVTPHIETAIRVSHFATLPADNLLPLCDAILVVGGERFSHHDERTIAASCIVKDEVEQALRLGKQVFFDIEGFKAAVLFDSNTKPNPKGETGMKIIKYTGRGYEVPEWETGMKIIKYMGREYEVPEWARFIATDADGEVYAFEFRPEFDDGDDECIGFWKKREIQPKGRHKLLDENGRGWKDSLVEIEE